MKLPAYRFPLVSAALLFLITLAPVATSPPTIVLRVSTWGGPLDDIGRGVAVDSSGNVLVTGSTQSFGSGSEKVVILKYGQTGSLLWQEIWGDNASDAGNSLAPIGTGGLFVAGSTSSYGAGLENALLMKLNSGDGGLLWAKTWGGNSSDAALGVATDVSGNGYLSGVTDSFATGNDYAFLIKFDPASSLDWQRIWGYNGTVGWNVAVDNSGSIYQTGYTSFFTSTHGDLFLVKYNSTGSLQWQITWGGSKFDSGRGVAVDSSGFVYVTGVTNSFGAGGGDLVLLKFDPNGLLLWGKVWGGVGYDYGQSIAVDPTGNIGVTGGTSSSGAGLLDAVLLKFDSAGNLLSEATWGGNSTDLGWGIVFDPAGYAYVTGSVSETGPYLLKPANITLQDLTALAVASSFQPQQPPGVVTSVTSSVRSVVGNQTYAGKSDLFVFKYGVPGAAPSLSIFPTLLTLALFVTCRVFFRRSFGRLG